LARDWCHGHRIDGAPALAHAVRVALKIGEHLPAAPPELVAAALVHDSPEFAPPDIDLGAVLTVRLGGAVTRVVWALQGEHNALNAYMPELPDPDDLWVLSASAAD
jgi:hypothetical protein